MTAGLILLVLILSGRTAAAEREAGSGFFMYEPQYAGLEVNGKPKFILSWEAYSGAKEYEIAFFAEGEDAYGRGPFAIRSTKGIYDGSTSATVVFLQGVYTDTVTYRIKVRPRLRTAGTEKPADFVWSNIWEIRFVDGQHTVRRIDEDFDQETVKSEEGTKITQPQPTIQHTVPLDHSYPEPLLTYLARERGKDTPFLPGEIAEFSVSVNHCEYGEPVQTIRDPEHVRAFSAALEDITVTGKQDSISSTETYYAYSVRDASGSSLFSFSIQRGLLERSDGRYGMTGLEKLLSLDGILYEDGWDSYWEDRAEKARAYRAGQKITGFPLTDAAGYEFSRIAETAPEGILGIQAYIDWNTEPGRLNTSDREEIAAIWNALSQVTVGEKISSPPGQMWHMTFSFLAEGGTFYDSTYLAFQGNAVKIGDYYYRLTGIDQVYSSVDNGMLYYLRDYSEAPKVQPSY